MKTNIHWASSLIIFLVISMASIGVGHAMELTVLGGIKKLPSSFHDEVEYQSAIGLQLEVLSPGVSLVFTVSHSQDKHKIGRAETFVEKVSVGTFEGRIGARWHYKSIAASKLYLGVGGGFALSDLKYKFVVDDGPLAPGLNRGAIADSETGIVYYIEVGQKWEYNKQINIGWQYNLTNSILEDRDALGIGSGLFGTVGWKF